MLHNQGDQGQRIRLDKLTARVNNLVVTAKLQSKLNTAAANLGAGARALTGSVSYSESTLDRLIVLREPDIEARTLSIQSHDQTSATNIAGAVSLGTGSGVAVGASVAVVNLSNNLDLTLINPAISTTNLTLHHRASEQVFNLAVAGAGGAGFALGASVAATELSGNAKISINQASDTPNHIGVASIFKAETLDDRQIANAAGSLAVGAGRGGIGAAVATVKEGGAASIQFAGEGNVLAGDVQIKVGTHDAVSLSAAQQSMISATASRSDQAMSKSGPRNEQGGSGALVGTSPTHLNVAAAAAGGRLVGVAASVSVLTQTRSWSVGVGAGWTFKTDKLSVLGKLEHQISNLAVGAGAAAGNLGIAVGGAVSAAQQQGHLDIVWHGSTQKNNDATDIDLQVHDASSWYVAALGGAVALGNQSGAIGLTVSTVDLDRDTRVQMTGVIDEAAQILVAADDGSRVQNTSVAAAIAGASSIAIAGGGAVALANRVVIWCRWLAAMQVGRPKLMLDRLWSSVMLQIAWIQWLSARHWAHLAVERFRSGSLMPLTSRVPKARLGRLEPPFRLSNWTLQMKSRWSRPCGPLCRLWSLEPLPEFQLEGL